MAAKPRSHVAYDTHTHTHTHRGGREGGREGGKSHTGGLPLVRVHHHKVARPSGGQRGSHRRESLLAGGRSQRWWEEPVPVGVAGAGGRSRRRPSTGVGNDCYSCVASGVREPASAEVRIFYERYETRREECSGGGRWWLYADDYRLKAHCCSAKRLWQSLENARSKQKPVCRLTAFYSYPVLLSCLEA